MIRITKNLIVLEDLYDILMSLRSDINNKGYLQNIKRSGKNILITCPFHKGGQEKKPSCGGTVDSPWFHCFTCGSVAHLLTIINHVFGKDDKDTFAENWIRENFNVARVDDRTLDSVPFRRDIKQEKNYVKESELKTYRKTHEYMYKRGLTDPLIKMFDVGYDPNFKLKMEDGNYGNRIPCITFPVRDKEGNTLFIARRSIEGKMFHYPNQVQKPVYGIYEFYKYGEFNKYGYVKELVVCESIFNAITCWKYGIPGVALLGTGTKEQYKVLSRLPVENLYLGLDPDRAGDKGTLKLIQNLKRNNVFIFDIPEGKDINDLNYHEFNNLRVYTPSEWKKIFFDF